MQLSDWVWIVLTAFFVVHGIAASYLLRSIVRIRRSQHRIANYVQIIGGQLQARGLVEFPADSDAARGTGSDGGFTRQ